MTDTTSGVTVGNVAVFSDIHGNIKDGGGPPDTAVGTVTSVSVTPHTGVTGTVANANTTPAISITLGAITPASVVAAGAVSGSNLSGTNTGDQTITLSSEASGSGTSGLAVTLSNAAIIAKVLTGYASSAGTVAATDSILQAIQKLNGNTALLTGAVIFQGTWNANTNTPALVSGVGTKGTLYKVSVAGTTSIDGISQWNVGDSIVFDGTVWDKIDGLANEVISVAGRTGVVVLSQTDVSGTVPTTTTVNGHALNANVTVSASDITTGTLPAAQLPLGSSSAFGAVKVDNTTITASAGVISAAAQAAFTTGTWAARPGSPTTGQLYFANDLGTGVMVIYTGAKWKPITGHATIAMSGVGVTTTAMAETNLGSMLVPAGLVSTNGGLRWKVKWNLVANAGTAHMIFRLSNTNGAVSGGLILDNPASVSPQFNSTSCLENLNSINTQYYDRLSEDSTAGVSNFIAGSTATSLFGSNTYININFFSSLGNNTGFYSYCLEWFEP